MDSKIYKINKDRYTKARGGSSKLLSIFCAQCSNEVLLYQKDGPGQLIRMYKDKILAPDNLVKSISAISEKKEMSAIKCFRCNAVLGIPMVYEQENRLAYRIVPGTVHKTENKKGIFPSNI